MPTTHQSKRPSQRLPKGRVMSVEPIKVTFARAKAITAMSQYAALLPKPKGGKPVKPHAVVRGMGSASFANGHNMFLSYAPFSDNDVCVVLPMPNRAQAARCVAFHNLTEGEQVERVRGAIRQSTVAPKEYAMKAGEPWKDYRARITQLENQQATHLLGLFTTTRREGGK